MLGFGQRKGKVRNGEERGREGAYLVDARRRRRAGKWGRVAPLVQPSPPGKKGTREKKGHGRFLFLFFVKSVNGEKSKTKPNWNGPKFLGCPKVSTKI